MDLPYRSRSSFGAHTCDFCRDIWRHAATKNILPNVFRVLTTHETVSQVRSFAKQHCIFFQLIWNTITAHRHLSCFETTSDEDDLTIEAHLRRVKASEDNEDYDRMVLEVGRSDRKTLKKYVDSFDLFTSPDDPASPWLSSRPRNVNIASNQSYALARSWIQGCLEGGARHRWCSKNPTASLPTRVIDVDGGLKLIVGANIQGSYATLSYCWGGPQSVTTTTANLQTHLAQIDFKALPATLQDAISVTRSLGIRFLWIDALCIVQDSVEDKAHEISSMAQIYQNSVVTISAASAFGASEGFLQPRKPFESERWSFRFAWRFLDGTLGNVIASPKVEYDPDDEPINTRAWTHQERLLSERILIYSSHNLLWQCRGYSASDGGVRGSYIPNMDHFVSVSVEHQAQMWSDWKEIVKSYSRKKVSVLEDKLVALSAIAALFEKHWTDAYRAGLWMPYLRQGLLWRAAKQEEDKRKPRAIYEDGGAEDYQAKIPPPTFFRLQRSPKYIAPSWSWASVDGPVIFPSIMNEDDLNFEVLDCAVTPVSQLLRLGAVRDGRMVLKGRVKPAYCVMYGTKLAAHNSPLRCGELLSEADAFGDVLVDESDRFNKNEAIKVWCLIAQTKLDSTAEFANGLLFVPTEQSRVKRVGLFSLTKRNAEMHFDWPNSGYVEKVLTVE